MDKTKIKVGNWYETKSGVGECVSAGGCHPWAAGIRIDLPFPRGKLFFAPRDVVREVPSPSIPVGKRVRLTVDGLGASQRHDLGHVTEERYGTGDEGVVVFRHPNVDACPDWVYVEVDSKAAPGEKRYVGVSPRMAEVL